MVKYEILFFILRVSNSMKILHARPILQSLCNERVSMRVMQLNNYRENLKKPIFRCDWQKVSFFRDFVAN